MSIKSRNAITYSIDQYLQYFYDIAVECPYNLPQKAVYRQQQFVSLPDDLFGKFLEAGFRRNGNTIYTMVCPNCSRCIPIRIEADLFIPNRNQKRVLRRNEDLTISMGSLKITEEKLFLCGRFLEQRYPLKGNSPVGYYGSFFANSVTSTVEIEYRCAGKLVGVAIVDIGCNWANAVYFYFDPSESGRSPGTFNILHLVDLCRKNNIKYVYLGYLIREVRAMKYKENFNPHFLLQKGDWVTSKK
ncbi:MAG: arginyltransferase [Deltaproteobacteria bacterium]|nr:arginyltransferase [Deltaproteobacteria bacterium]